MKKIAVAVYAYIIPQYSQVLAQFFFMNSGLVLQYSLSLAIREVQSSGILSSQFGSTSGKRQFIMLIISVSIES